MSDGVKVSIYLLILLKAGERLIEGCQEDQRVIVQTVVTFSDTVCTTRNTINISFRAPLEEVGLAEKNSRFL